MQKVYKILVLALVTSLVSVSARSQQSSSDTTITSIDVDLLNIFNQKTPRKYKVAAIRVIGNRFFDENLLISIANINVGDEINIPGGDNFSKAITKLWGQNYFSNVEIYITKLEGKNIDIEIAVTERPRLSKFFFKGVRKGETEDLAGKTGLVPNRVITENMKISAVEAIKKFYAEKGFRDTKVTIVERKDTSFNNTLALDFVIDKGPKVKINNINFFNTTIEASKLKKELKDTKERSRFTLTPTFDSGYLGTVNRYTFAEYIKDNGYLTYSKTKKVLDPYIRLKLTGAKFDEKKYVDDKENILAYYNSLGYRDADH
jgi:outer membrane protein insertion porin family